MSRQDRFGRILHLGDPCFRVNTSLHYSTINVACVQDFTSKKVKIANKTYVNSNNLILISTRGLECFLETDKGTRDNFRL